MQLTKEQFIACLPRCNNVESWLLALNDHLDLHGISSAEQTAMFLAQVGHESVDLTMLSENLNYSDQGLLKVFPKYFNSETAKQFARKPVEIANTVYANRNGNGDFDSGDGYMFRGSGPLQLTFRGNFSRCSFDLFNDDRLIKTPDSVRIVNEVGLMSALWFWDKNQLSSVDSVERATKIINGGQLGIEDRTSRYERCLSVLL